MAAAFGHALGVEPEGRGHERREGLDVRAGDEDVARFQRRVVGEQAEHDLAEHLDLPVRAVAGVHLDGPVVGGEHVVVGRGAVVADVALQPPEQRRRRIVRRRMVRCRVAATAGQPQLQLPDVAAERRRAAGGGGAPRSGRRGAAGTPSATCGDPLPQGGGGVRQPQVHVAVPGQRGEHGEVVVRAGGWGRTATAAPAGRRAPGSRSSRGDRGGEPFRRVRRVDPRPQRPPQLGLPAQVVGHLRVVAGPPGVEQLRAVRGVGGEQAREVRDHGEPAARPVQVGGQRGAPRAARAGVDDLHERPHRARRLPRVVGGRDAAGAVQRGRDDVAGGGEDDVRAHPVARPAAVPSRWARRCASQRSMPRAGTATTSAVNGSAGGSARTSARASARVSERSARCRCSTGLPTDPGGAGFRAVANGVFHATQPKAWHRRLREVPGGASRSCPQPADHVQ